MRRRHRTADSIQRGDEHAIVVAVVGDDDDAAAGDDAGATNGDLNSNGACR